MLSNSEARAFYFGERYGLERVDAAREAAEDELRNVLNPDPPNKDEKQMAQDEEKESDDIAPDR